MCNAGMQRSLFIAVLVATSLLSYCTTPAESPADKHADQGKDGKGWLLLFDGRTTEGWTSYCKSSFPTNGWKVEDGWLVCLGGGDLVSTTEYRDFELEWEWKIETNGNSGLKYFVLDSRKSAIGHEFQMIDDGLVADRGKQTTGAFYDVVPPSKHASKPPGEVNQSRIVIRGGLAEHWLNGEKVVAYRFGSPELKAAISSSKFKDTPGFGEKVSGRILLQDHGSKAWFRNIRIRRLE
jgi:hypothetical protein